MPRIRFLFRAACVAVLALPLSSASGCSSAFSPGGEQAGDDASVAEAGDDAVDDIVVVIYHDAQAQDAGGDGTAKDATGSSDGPSDAPSGCPTGDLTCNGHCVPNDVKNCGTCGHDCTNLPHVSGTTSCTSNGACTFPPSACAPGWADCNGVADDGCETDISKPSHCGSCTNACGATDPLCQGSGSTYTCVSGCTGSTPTLCNGSCVNTTNDPNDCGGCAMGTTHVCTGAPKNAQNTCVNSACSYSCNTGYAGCNGGCISTSPGPGVFVSPGGASAGCGSINAPCSTIAAALKVVPSNGTIYLDKGTYTEQVQLPANITVQGGWSYLGAGNWTHECANAGASSIIAAPPGMNRTIIAAGGTLDTLTIKNTNTAAAGQTLYGVFATGSLTLSDVSISVADGGAAAPVGQAGTGANGSTAGCSTSGLGTAGSTGNPGSPGSSSYGPSGFSTSASPAGTGATGAAGDYGTAPSSPACIVSQDGCAMDCSDTGGGGNTVCGGSGLAGCPGQGGVGGLSGQGGGASIGLFAYGAVTITINGGQWSSGKGGNGSAGGLGGSGGTGAPGVAGNAVGVMSGCGVNATTHNCYTRYTNAAGGGAGGNGGAGGKGGQGGGGAGGDSYCYVIGGGAKVPTPAGPNCVYGSPGSGGGPNGQGGSAGVSKAF